MNKGLTDKLRDVFCEIATEFEGFLWCHHEMLLKYNESPIESLMMAGFLASHRFGPRLTLREPESFKDFVENEKAPALYVFPQVTLLDKFRVDFVVARKMPDEKPQYIVVECDGHEFHEKTREQAERDKSRDRELTTAGYTVMRFTGREIWRNAIKCADQVIWVIEGHGRHV